MLGSKLQPVLSQWVWPTDSCFAILICQMIPEVDLIDTLLFSNSDGLDAANYKVTAYSVFGMCHKKAFFDFEVVL